MSFFSFSSLPPNPFGDPLPNRGAGFDLRAAIDACESGSDEEAVAAVGASYRWLDYFAPRDTTPLAMAARRASATALETALKSGSVDARDDAARQALGAAIQAGSQSCVAALLAFGVKMTSEAASLALNSDNLEALAAGLGQSSAKSINRKLGTGATEEIFFIACDRGALRCARFLIGRKLDWGNLLALKGLRALGRDKQDELILFALIEGGLSQNKKTMAQAAMARREPFDTFHDLQALCEAVGESPVSERAGARRI